jgi:threonine aldolase
LWHAAIVTGLSEAELARPFDTVNVCFSKGLGAPVGSALAGTRDTIARARRFRKMLGGGMRQAGILAAGALFALEKQRARLSVDHETARELAQILETQPGVRVVTPETNIVALALALEERSAAGVVERARALGVLLNATGEHTLRAVTHLDVTLEQVKRAGERLCQAIGA